MPLKDTMKECMMGGSIILLIFQECIYEGNLSIAVTNYFIFGVHAVIITFSIIPNTLPIF